MNDRGIVHSVCQVLDSGMCIMIYTSCKEVMCVHHPWSVWFHLTATLWAIFDHSPPCI